MANNVNDVDNDVIPVSVITLIKYSECEDDVQDFQLSLFGGMLTQEVVELERVKNLELLVVQLQKGRLRPKTMILTPGNICQVKLMIQRRSPRSILPEEAPKPSH